MPHFKLFQTAQKRAELLVDEIVLRRNQSGEATHSVSVHSSSELPDDMVDNAKAVAGSLGYTLAEVEPDEKVEDRQPVGDDVRGMSPSNIGDSGQQAGAQSGPSPANAPTGTPSPTPGQTPGSTQSNS